MTLRDHAEHLIDKALFGDIPKRMQFHIDFNAIARNLAVDYAETTIDGINLTYRCA